MSTEPNKPLLFEQSKVGFVDIDSVNLPETNSDEEPVLPLTAEQRYLFDTHGWLLVPGLLSEAEVKEMREYLSLIHI